MDVDVDVNANVKDILQTIVKDDAFGAEAKIGIGQLCIQNDITLGIVIINKSNIFPDYVMNGRYNLKNPYSNAKCIFVFSIDKIEYITPKTHQIYANDETNELLNKMDDIYTEHNNNLGIDAIYICEQLFNSNSNSNDDEIIYHREYNNCIETTEIIKNIHYYVIKHAVKYLTIVYNLETQYEIKLYRYYKSIKLNNDINPKTDLIKLFSYPAYQTVIEISEHDIINNKYINCYYLFNNKLDLCYVKEISETETIESFY